MRFEGSLPQRRAYHISFVHCKTLYIHGGEDFYSGILDSMWALPLDFIEQGRPKWRSVPSSKLNPGPLSRHAAVLNGDNAFVVGGLQPDGQAN